MATWRRPAPLGLGAASESMSTVAAPLLAGFSIATAGVISQSPSSYLLPGLTLIALTSSVIALVACVQFGFHARQYLYSREELQAWLPVKSESQSPPEIGTDLSRNQDAHFELWRRWSNRSATAFNIGILSIGLALTLTFVPPPSYAGVPLGAGEAAARWAAALLALIGTLAEAGWWMGEEVAPVVGRVVKKVSSRGRRQRTGTGR